MAGEFSLYRSGGDVYSVDEVRHRLGQSGWRVRDQRPLAGAQSLITAEAP
jgi:hypothetical protein